MASPLKPWERSGVSSQNIGGVPPCCASGAGVSVSGATGGVAGAAAERPPPPPRPGQQTVPGTLSRYGGATYGTGYGMGGYGGGMYASPYSMYGGGMSGGMYGGGYGGYGGYGGGYGASGGPQTNTFVQQAEESSRQAFQSIESIVHAFSSISMMLDSTYSAVYNSFRAVLGVADHFTRVKNHFGQIFSAFALIRTLRWLYRKLLVLLGLRESGLVEDIWSQAADLAPSAGITEAQLKRKSNWPVMLFVAVTLGGPWLIWKLINSFSEKEVTSEWASGVDDHFVARGLYEFTGQAEEELSFKEGQLIHIAPKELQPRVKGWLLACADGVKTGLIPANYIRILGKRRGKRHQAEPPTPQTAGSVPQGQPSDSSFVVEDPLSEQTVLDEAFKRSSPTPDSSSMNEFFEASQEGPSTELGQGQEGPSTEPPDKKPAQGCSHCHAENK